MPYAMESLNRHANFSLPFANLLFANCPFQSLLYVNDLLANRFLPFAARPSNLIESKDLLKETTNCIDCMLDLADANC